MSPRLAPSPVLRRLLAVALGAALVVALAVVALGGRAAAQDEPVERFPEGSCSRAAVRFGVVVPDGGEGGRAAAQRLATDLGELLACPVELVLRRDPGELVAGLALHQIDLAQLDPEALVVANRVAGIGPIVAYGTGLGEPARGSAARIWVTRDGARRLADLRGGRVALGVPGTAGGDLLPRRALQAAGLRAGAVTGAGDVRLAPPATTDAEALERVRRGRVDAAVTTGPVADADARGLRAAWSSPPLLGDVLAARPGLPGALRRRLGAALRALSGVSLLPLARRAGIDQPTGLVSVPLDLYGPIADALDHLTAAGLRP